MKVAMSYTPSELDRVTEELRICRLELAQARAAQEEAAESASAATSRAKRLSAQLRDLSLAANEHLEARFGDTKSFRAGRVASLIPGRRNSDDDDVSRIRASESFSGPWYLIQHPEVLANGRSPALHYLRHGAAAGFDPSPQFSTRDYLRSHPEVAKSGMNPLVHHLATQQQDSGTSL